MWNVLNNSYKKIIFDHIFLTYSKYDILGLKMVQLAARDEKQKPDDFLYDLGKEYLVNRKINYLNIPCLEIMKQGIEIVNQTLDEFYKNKN
jgi:hypothetical protein